MTLEIRLQSAAESDLAEATTWYENQQRGLGAAMLAEVERGFDAIRTTPQRFPLVHGNIRRMLIARFPFGIFYQQVDAACIVVFAVMHASRDPGRWQQRVT